MTFNSLYFIAFFAAVVAGFHLLKRHVLARNAFLLAASGFFYEQVAGDARWLLLLLGTAAFDYAVARLIERFPVGDRRRRWCVIGSCVVNLSVLGFFKYFNFFVDNLVILGDTVGRPIARPALSVLLPAGISFYTLQSIGYVIDVSRGHLRAERHPVHYGLFVAFFPQLIAGPIERAGHLLPQLKSPVKPTWDDACHGTWLIGLGLFKKVVLADNVARVANAVLLAHEFTPRPWESVLGVYAFAVQIYCDFSAYSDIARGAARVLGFDLMRNFDLPYLAVNPSDFWRRWHISLGTWLRDYLYVPLGGNRDGPVATYRNLLLTMLIGGLWHGATWLFVMWGAYHGILLCTHRALRPLLQRFFTFKSRTAAAAWMLVRVVVFFQFTCFGWLLFRAGSVENFWRILRPSNDVPPTQELLKPPMVAAFAVITLTLLVGQLVKYFTYDHTVIFRLPVPLRAVVYAGMIWAFLVFGVFDGNEFIYFQF